jgi:protein-L-isoaspartate(D-aspartate) O-methyltransferase
MLEQYGEFDAIHVGAAPEEVPPQLIAALKPGGRMVIPVGPQFQQQYLKCIDKDLEGHLHEQIVAAVGYVPLTAPGAGDE